MDRVLEIGGIAAGYCGRLFTHAGADVVRVTGMQTSATWASEGATDLFLHAGKRSINTEDADLIAELAARADVVVCQGNTADELHAAGFDAWQAPLKLALTPFGLTGPKRNWRASPNVILAMAGYTQLIGDGGRVPLSLPGHYVEFQTAAIGYAAANACLGVGQSNLIDVSMLESVMSLSQFTTVRWHCAGELRSRHGSDFWFVVPSNLFKCADGWIYLNIIPSFWDPLTVFLGRPELLVDERFLDNDLRMQNRDELHEVVAAVVAIATRQQLAERAEECRVPLGVVQTFDDVLEDPHLAERDFWQQIEFSDVEVKSPRLPYRYVGEEAPLLAQQTEIEASCPW